MPETNEKAIRRLRQLRDELKSTPEGRVALDALIKELKEARDSKGASGTGQAKEKEA